ncbi:MAG: type II secretion system F family protein [Ignavibacteriales bacterium]|nr:type II secretion system F family protein [Ignavibacteriales bacterium]
MFRKVSHKDFIEFNRIFSLLLLSKISITTAFELIIKQIKNENFKQILNKILKDVKAGNSLSKSFSKYPNVFSEIYLANLKVAEETGNIAQVLNEYTNYLEKFQILKRKISQAMRYPLLVILVSVGVVFFMLYFLIPTFESLFVSLQTQIPPLTKFILDMSNFIVDKSEILFLILVVAILSIYYISRTEYFRVRIFDRAIIKIPLFSSLFKKNILARFSLSMSILIQNGISLLDALKISKNITRNSIFKNEINLIEKKLVKGETFSVNVGKSKFFDITFSKLLVAGEESAELEKVFSLISDYYSNEFDYKLENITSLIEPFLILIVGLVVAIILISMYIPMFEIINYLGV